jgi:hypothetical protein
LQKGGVETGFRRQERRDRSGNRSRHDETRDSSDRRDHQALGKELADEPDPIRPDSQAYAKLGSPGGGAAQQHVGDVGTADEQDQTDHRHEEGRTDREARSFFGIDAANVVEAGGHSAIARRVSQHELPRHSS